MTVMNTLEDKMVTTSWNLVPALATTPKCFCNTSKGECFRREISKEASIICYEVVINRLQSYYCWEHCFLRPAPGDSGIAIFPWLQQSHDLTFIAVVSVHWCWLSKTALQQSHIWRFGWNPSLSVHESLNFHRNQWSHQKSAVPALCPIPSELWLLLQYMIEEAKKLVHPLMHK